MQDKRKYNEEQLSKALTDINASLALLRLQKPLDDERIEAFEIASHCILLKIPQLVISGAWEPNRCPTCDEELGGDCDDGYYDNPHYDSCFMCGQKLKYKED